MSAWREFLFRSIFGLFIFQGVNANEVWMHSSVYIPEISEGYLITQVGQGQQSWREAPGVLPARMKISGNGDESLLLACSNGLQLSYKGNGSLAFERFEQRVSDGNLRGLSRSILSMDTGTLEIDCRSIAGGSQVLLELPIGSILMYDTLGSVVLEYDIYSRVYRFALHCAQGSLELTDLSGEHYSIETDQAITGAGSSINPSLEISDLDERMSGRLGAFVLRCRDELSEVDENPQEWLSQMSIISMMQDRVLRDDFVLRTNPEGKQPYIIELSFRPRLFIPRYGVSRALSEDDEELY